MEGARTAAGEASCGGSGSTRAAPGVGREGHFGGGHFGGGGHVRFGGRGHGFGIMHFGGGSHGNTRFATSHSFSGRGVRGSRSFARHGGQIRNAPVRSGSIGSARNSLAHASGFRSGRLLS